jgi:hypothetical protein
MVLSIPQEKIPQGSLVNSIAQRKEIDPTTPEAKESPI